MISKEELCTYNSKKLAIAYMKKHHSDFVDFLKLQFQRYSYEEALYLYMHNMTEAPKCPTCGNALRFLNKSKGYTQYCCSACANKSITKKQQIRQTVLEKYGVENISQLDSIKEQKIETCNKNYGGYGAKSITDKAKNTCLEKYGDANYKNFEKIRKTCLEKYGVEYAIASDKIKEKIKNTNLQKYNSCSPFGNKEIQEKSEKTCLEKYGVKNGFQSEIAKTKYRITCLEKYGVEHASQSEIVKNKVKQTCLERYGVENPFSINKKEKLYKAKRTCLEKYGVPYYVLTQECMANFANDSKPNREFAKLLEDNKMQYEREYQIEIFAYDFKIGNILIEINPFPTHNSTWGVFNNPKKPEYHLIKSGIAKKHNFLCIHVWDWDDQNKIINLLKEKQSIYARKCELRKVNKKELDSFLNNYHLQGTCKGQKIALGLYYENELVQLMTFGKPRYNKKYEYELLRLCTKSGYTVIGGAQKIFKHFLEEYNPTSIISYCDNAKFSGAIYSTLGFNLVSKGAPSKHWYNGKVHITDNMLRQLGYDKIFGTNYGKGTSNEQLMLEHKFVEIYDCGQSVYSYQKVSSTIS